MQLSVHRYIFIYTHTHRDIYKRYTNTLTYDSWDELLSYKYLNKLQSKLCYQLVRIHLAHESSLLILFATEITWGNSVPTKLIAPTNIWIMFFFDTNRLAVLSAALRSPLLDVPWLDISGLLAPALAQIQGPFVQMGFYVGHFSKAPSP